MPPLSQRDVASVTGRSQAPELFATIPFDAGASPYIQRTFNITRPLESFHFVLKIRAKFVTQSMVTIAQEAPQTLLQRLRITGTHRIWSALTPIDLTGATMFAWNRLFGPRGNSVYMSTNGGPITRLPELSTPIQTLVAGTSFGKKDDTYDLEIHWDVPVTPFFPIQVKGGITPFLWFPQDWADTIQIQPFFGDAASFGSIIGDGGDVEFSDYGSNTGAGTFSVYATYQILGPLANAVQSAVCLKSTQSITAPVSAIANFTQLLQLQKQKTTNLVIKAGTYFTGNDLEPGVQVFKTLDDGLLARTQMVVDNKPIRNNQDNMGQKEYLARMFESMFPQGYLGFSFIDSMIPLTYFRGDNLPGGANFALFSDVTDDATAQAAEIVQEQVFGEPGINFAAGNATGGA